MKGDVYDIEE